MNENDVVFVFIDFQEKMIAAMDEDLYANVRRNARIMAESALVLEAPLIYTQQYTKGLGETDPGIREFLKSGPIEKSSFSCWRCPEFSQKLSELNRKQVVILGMEAHICVVQTALDLKANGFEVMVLEDGVISRDTNNKKTGLDFLKQAQIYVANTELALFQILKKAGSEKFKKISKLVK